MQIYTCVQTHNALKLLEINKQDKFTEIEEKKCVV